MNVFLSDFPHSVEPKCPASFLKHFFYVFNFLGTIGLGASLSLSLSLSLSWPPHRSGLETIDVD